MNEYKLQRYIWPSKPKCKLVLLVYWSGFLLLWTIWELSIEFDIYFFLQAFEANASSSGGKLSVNDQLIIVRWPLYLPYQLLLFEEEHRQLVRSAEHISLGVIWWVRYIEPVAGSRKFFFFFFPEKKRYNFKYEYTSDGRGRRDVMISKILNSIADMVFWC